MKHPLTMLVILAAAPVAIFSQIKNGYVHLITTGEKMSIIYPSSKNYEGQTATNYTLGFYIPGGSITNDSTLKGGIVLLFQMTDPFAIKNKPHDHNQCVIGELFIALRKYNASLEYAPITNHQEHDKNRENKRYLLSNISFFVEKESLQTGISNNPYIKWYGKNYFELN